MRAFFMPRGVIALCVMFAGYLMAGAVENDMESPEGAPVPDPAERYHSDDNGPKVIYELGKFEIINTQSSKEVKDAIESARPIEPSAIPTPKFTIRTRDNSFMLTIGGKINPYMGYDIGNDLYSADPGAGFITGDIPVPPLTGHRSDFFINALHGDIDFTFVGFAGTANKVTGYVKFGTNGSSKSALFKRAYITWRNVSVGLKNSVAEDGAAVQPPTIDPQGPGGDVSTATYQISYQSPSYNGFRFAAALEMPTYDNSNGIYRGKDFTSWYGHKVNSEVSQVMPDIPLWIEYTFSKNNRLRATAILRHFSYQDMIDQTRRSLFGWGTMLSGNFSFWSPLVFNFQAVYGRGIGTYIQDLSGRPISFTPRDNELGRMQANPMMGLVFGASLNATHRLQFNAVGSYTRIWDVENYATFQDQPLPDANGVNVMSAGNANFRYSIYAAVNCFYSFTDYLKIGLEYLYGRHATYQLGAANDSRIQTQLVLTF